MSTVNTPATDTAVKGVNKQPIADDVGLGKTGAATAPPPPVVTPGKCSTGRPVCGAKAQFYAAGWRCSAHRPGAQPPPQHTAPR